VGSSISQWMMRISLLLLSLNGISFQAKTKNIIMIIGDGMGPQQIGLLEAYATQAPDSVIKNGQTAFTRLLEEGGRLGISMTHVDNVLVADSAASATQLATGKPASSEMIGIDAEGRTSLSILEIAKKMGKSTGLVSDVRITHATTAAFAAHQPHRSMENQIAEGMLKTAPDVMLSGGLRHWIPQSVNQQQSADYEQLQQLTGGLFKISSKRTDNRNLLLEAKQQGYQLAFNKNELQQANGKLLGLFANSALPDAISAKKNNYNNYGQLPSLRQMSSKAIDLLSKNDKGFFLMIEAGLLDWAAHYNDTGTLLHEMIKMNNALDYVLNWAKNRDDTLIIVTGDHETGGFGFSFSGSDIPEATKFPGTQFKNSQFKPRFNFGDPKILDKIYNQKSSYTEIFSSKFDQLPKQQQTAAQLKKLINQDTEFHITEAQAARILQTEKNPNYVKGHKYLGNKIVPKMLNNDAFFVYQQG